MEVEQRVSSCSRQPRKYYYYYSWYANGAATPRYLETHVHQHSLYLLYVLLYVCHGLLAQRTDVRKGHSPAEAGERVHDSSEREKLVAKVCTILRRVTEEESWPPL